MWTDGGDAATTSQLLEPDASALMLDWEIVTVTPLWDIWAACCWRAPLPLSSFPCRYAALFAPYKKTLAREALAKKPTLRARATRDASPLTLVWGLVETASTQARQEVHCWRLYLPLFSFLRPSVAFFATRKETLANEMRSAIPALGNRAACAAAFSRSPEGTNFGILEDGGLSGETVWAAVYNI